MDEDKISSNASEKRKIEEDSISPKPNTKRIKLVRPVFSSVTKPTITTINETSKSNVHPTEIPKFNNASDHSLKVVNVISQEKCHSDSVKMFNETPRSANNTTEPPETIEKSVEVPETIEKSIEVPEIIEKSIEVPETVNESVKLPETVNSLVEPLENANNFVESAVIVKSHVEPSESVKEIFDPIETIKNPTESHVTTIVSEEQVDSSSDALDIPNIFSEETKKELENLKKKIFKIEDDGSSSENDSQPKRPRLKRPTFVTSVYENKVESNSSIIPNKINETCKLDSLKLVSEENINVIGSTLETSIKTQSFAKDIKEAEKIAKTINIAEEKNINISNLNIIKKETVVIENVEQILEDESSINTNEEEKPSELLNVHKLVEKESSETKSSEIILEDKPKSSKNIPEVSPKTVNSKRDDTKLMLNDIETDLNDQEKIAEKDKVDILIDEKLTDVEKNNQTTGGPTKSIKMKTEEILNGNMHEDPKSNYFENVQVIAERYVDSKSTNKIEHDGKDTIIAEIPETNEAKLIEGCNKNEETTIEANVEADEKENSPNNQTHLTTDVDEYPNLENEKQESNIIIEVENKTNTSFDMSSKLKLDEHESQKFNSDILKAALMSKKSLENISDDEHNTTIQETKEIEILPTIGEEAIVNKIETEIKLPSNDLPTNVLTLQDKIHSNVSETIISKDMSSSNYCYENMEIDKNDEPPKWGSAKMNEVEKFLNDSNVTITPISKSQETPKLGKITLKLPKIGNPEIKTETTVHPDVKSELLKKIVNNRISMGDSPLKSALSQPSESFKSFAAIRPILKPSAEQIALLEQQILNTPKKRGRPSKALAQQKQLLLQYQQLQHKAQEGDVEASDESVFHAPLFDMEDMSERTGVFDSFNASTPIRVKNVKGKNSRGRKPRGGCSRGRNESDSDIAPKINCMDDDAENYQRELNEDEETKQVALIEAERLRKEELRERKLEERKKKLKERSDLLKEKKLKKKQRAEERRLQWHEKKRIMQEEKARAAEMKKSLPPPQNFDDETRMSADYNSRSQTPARNFMMIDDDLSISGTTNDSIRMKKGRMEVIDFESNKTLTVDQIAEYQWPLEGGELYMIQEQISNFLGVKSFKRKYPNLKRRNVEAEERTFLCDSGLVAESLCDLGLTVLYSSEVLDIMYADFPEKYEELREYMRLKHAKELSNRQRALTTISSNTDGSKLDVRDRTLEAAANWNANFNKSRLESRKSSMDMQTFIVHYPKNKCKKMAIPRYKIGNYPLALLPGQFCDYYATYLSEDLRYLPLNTVMYGPLKSVDKDFPVSLSSQSESEDSSSDDSSDSDDSIDMDNKLGTNGLECGPSDKKGAECKLCLGTAEKNKKELAEPLIHCSKCLTIYHPTCLEMTLEMVPHIKRYNWQCNECKSCAQCKELADEDKMLFCDLCDRGYHIYCVGLRKVPEGRWHCQECAMCSSCRVSDPGPGDSKWFYEFKKIEKNGSKVYCRTLCAPCSRSWKKGHYCPNCMRCYTIKNIERMTQCNSCDRYLHPECMRENTPNRQVVTCTICEEKAVSRLLTTVPRSLIKV